MDELKLIYHFKSSQNQAGEFRPARYKVIYFFSEMGFIEDQLLKELSKSIPESNYHDLTFLSLDDLKQFSLRVAEEVQSPSIRLISIQDYNIGLDGAKDMGTFKNLFSKYGEVVVNQAAVKKKSFLGKLFS